jgi:hypothetical protein
MLGPIWPRPSRHAKTAEVARRRRSAAGAWEAEITEAVEVGYLFGVNAFTRS